MVKKIGIFAGTFDPIHEGHLAFAQAGIELGLEKVMFLPEPRPRRKQGVRALEHRIAMVQLAVASRSSLGVIELTQARFTVHETLPPLKARFPGHQLVMMFGDDVIAHIADWPHIDALVKSTELLIASRSNKIADLRLTLKTLEQTKGLKLNYQIVKLKSPNIKVASTKIRQNIKHGKTTEGLTDEVLAYVRRNNLYASVIEES